MPYGTPAPPQPQPCVHCSPLWSYIYLYLVAIIPFPQYSHTIPPEPRPLKKNQGSGEYNLTFQNSAQGGEFKKKEKKEEKKRRRKKGRKKEKKKGKRGKEK